MLFRSAPTTSARKAHGQADSAWPSRASRKRGPRSSGRWRGCVRRGAAARCSAPARDRAVRLSDVRVSYPRSVVGFQNKQRSGTGVSVTTRASPAHLIGASASRSNGEATSSTRGAGARGAPPGEWRREEQRPGHRGEGAGSNACRSARLGWVAKAARFPHSAQRLTNTGCRGLRRGVRARDAGSALHAQDPRRL